jgi:hypothetical protein
LQEHRAFCREYDRVARSVDRALVGSGPSKATFYRWLAGGIQGLPHPAHCRVLEKIFPGWTVTALFGPWSEEDAETALSDPTGNARTVANLGDVSAVYPSRSDFAHELPPHVLLDEATSVHAVGLS